MCLYFLLFCSARVVSNSNIIFIMKTCRLCLGNTADIYIFDSRKTLLPKFLSYCKLQMYKSDGLPEHVCVGCVEKLEEVVRFINQCEESDRMLRSNLDVDFVDTKTKKPDIKEAVLVEFKEEDVEVKLMHDFDLSDFENDTKDDSRDIFDDEKESVTSDNFNKIEKHNKVKKRKKSKGSNTSLLCPVCGKYFTRNSLYLEHMRRHGKREVICDECPKTFCSRIALKEHKHTHISVRNYKCEYCEKTFKTRHYVNQHMEYTHRKTKPLPCKICGKVFYRSQNLKHHALVHTQEPKFECNMCSKTFTFLSKLNLHMRIHTGDRPHACRFCDSKFTVPKSLKEHERLHTGERPFKCPACLKGFAQEGNMKSHFKYNHKGMDFKKAVIATRLSQS